MKVLISIFTAVNSRMNYSRFAFVALVGLLFNGSVTKAHSQPESSVGRSAAKLAQPHFPRVLPARTISTRAKAMSPRCLKPFILIEENSTTELATFLASNLDCLNQEPRYEGRSYLTFALEADRADAIRELLTVKGDPRKFQRFFDSDSRGKSLYSIAKADIVAYRPLIQLVYDSGMRAELGNTKENLADLTWLARDGAKTVSLVLDHKVFARYKGTTEDDYVVAAAREIFGEYIALYSDRTGMPLTKKFNNVGNWNTLLEIGAQNMWENNFSLSLHELYLKRGHFIEKGRISLAILSPLTRLREPLQKANKPALVQQLDEFFMLIAATHVDAWADLVDNTVGYETTIENLLESVLVNKTAPLTLALEALVPVANPVRVWSLLGSIEWHSRYPELLDALMARGRFPNELQVGRSLTAEVYVRGVEMGLYAAKCDVITLNPQLGKNLQIAHLDRLVAKGMNPTSCVGADEAVLGWATLQVTLYLSKLSGKLSPGVARYHSPKDFLTFLDIVKAYGLFSQFLSWLNDGGWVDTFYGSSDLLTYLEHLKKVALLADFSTWLQTKASNGQQILLCLKSNNQDSFAPITQAYALLGIDPASCYKHTLQTARWSEYGRLIATDKVLARKLIRDFGLSAHTCSQHGFDEVLSLMRDYDLEPAECWQAQVERFSSSGHQFGLKVAELKIADAFLETYPAALAQFHADLTKVEAMCAGPYPMPVAVTNAHIHALANTPGPVGLACLRGMARSPTHLHERLHGAESVSIPTSVSGRRLKRDLAATEIDLLLSASRAQLRFTRQEYKAFDDDFSVIAYYVGPSMMRHLDSLSESGINALVSRWATLTLADYHDANEASKNCMEEPSLLGQHLMRVGCDGARWTEYNELYKQAARKRTFLGTWLKAVEAEVRSRNLTGQAGQVLDVAASVLLSRGIIVDHERGRANAVDYGSLTQDDFLAGYCRVQPKEKQLEKYFRGPYFGEQIKDLTGYQFIPSHCP